MEVVVLSDFAIVVLLLCLGLAFRWLWRQLLAEGHAAMGLISYWAAVIMTGGAVITAMNAIP